MGYRLNRLDEPVFMAGQKPMRTEFGIHQRLESCGKVSEWLVPEVQEVVDFIPEVNFRDNHLP